MFFFFFFFLLFPFPCFTPGLEIDEWLAKFDQRVDGMEKSATYLWNLINTTAKEFSRCDEADLGEFLAEPVDLDLISQELSKLGIVKSTFADPPPSQSAISNKAVVDFEAYRNSQGLPKHRAIHWLTSSSGEPSAAVQVAINSAVKTYTGLVKNKRRHPDTLDNFLKSEFCVPHKRLKTSASNDQSPLAEVKVKPFPKQCAVSPKPKLSKKCENCDELKSKNEALVDMVHSLQKENCSIKKDLNESCNEVSRLKESAKKDSDRFAMKLDQEKLKATARNKYILKSNALYKSNLSVSQQTCESLRVSLF